MAKALFPDKVEGKLGMVNVDDIIKDKKAIAIYFSAHWCPPCRAFTPKLAEFYQARRDKLEVIFVSLDRTKKDFNDYFDTMPAWYAIPFEDDKRKSLPAKFKVNGIPSLIIVNSNGNIMSSNGRGELHLCRTGQLPDNWTRAGRNPFTKCPHSSRKVWYIRKSFAGDAELLLNREGKVTIGKPKLFYMF